MHKIALDKQTRNANIRCIAVKEDGDKVKQKILVIFENEKAYKQLQVALESITTTTVFAATTDDAIRLFVNHEYCLVIMDASVSDADGQRLLKIMQTIQPTPILLLSSNTAYPDRLAAFNSGAI